MLLFWFLAMNGFWGAFVADLIGVALKAFPEKSGKEGIGAVEGIGAARRAGAKTSIARATTPVMAAIENRPGSRPLRFNLEPSSIRTGLPSTGCLYAPARF